MARTRHPVTLGAVRASVHADTSRTDAPVYLTLSAAPMWLCVDLTIGEAEELRAALSRAIADAQPMPQPTRDEVTA